LLLALLSGARPAPPPEQPWPEAPRELRSERAASLAAAFPESAQMQRLALGACLARGDAPGALAAATRLADMGATLSAASRDKVAPLIGPEAAARLAVRFDANAAPLAASSLFARIPADIQLVEGLAWDPQRRALYATSVFNHALVRLAPAPGPVAAGGDLGGLFGAIWDARRKRVWAASSPTELGDKRGSFSGVVAIDPRNGAVTRIPAPPGAPAQLGDVALAPDGSVYASDGRTGAVYRCLPGCTALEPWVRPGTLFSAQGMAVSEDSKWLYVADYRYGLAAVERSSGRVFRVASRLPAMLDGIDGMVRRGRDLIVVQNGIRPQRIVRLTLSADGLAVMKVSLLERLNPDWGEPTLATLAGDRLLYVADGQWERFDDPAKPQPARPTPIRMIALGR
jgi:sugar lactone lactonase YvrE